MTDDYKNYDSESSFTLGHYVRLEMSLSYEMIVARSRVTCQRRRSVGGRFLDSKRGATRSAPIR